MNDDTIKKNGLPKPKEEHRRAKRRVRKTQKPDRQRKER